MEMTGVDVSQVLNLNRRLVFEAKSKAEQL